MVIVNVSSLLLSSSSSTATATQPRRRRRRPPYTNQTLCTLSIYEQEQYNAIVLHLVVNKCSVYSVLCGMQSNAIFVNTNMVLLFSSRHIVLSLVFSMRSFFSFQRGSRDISSCIVASMFFLIMIYSQAHCMLFWFVETHWKVVVSFDQKRAGIVAKINTN